MSLHDTSPGPDHSAVASKSRGGFLERLAKPRLPLPYSIRLAVRDLWHNKASSLPLVCVVCFVSLPLLILGSVEESYVHRLTRVIEEQYGGKRVFIKSPANTGEEKYITPDLLERIKTMPGVSAAIPVITMVASVYAGGWERYVDIEGMLPDDPELRYETVEGDISRVGYRDVVLSTRHKAMFGDIALGDTIALFFTRTGKREELERFSVKCRVAAFLPTQEVSKIRISLPLANDLRLWSLGYGVPALHLPPAIEQEIILGETMFRGCRCYPYRNEVTAADSVTLKVRNLLLSKRTLTVGGKAGTSYYYLERADGGLMSNKELKDLRFSQEWIIVPDLTPVECTINGQSFFLSSTIPYDPLGRDVLIRGRWLSPLDTRLSVVLPLSLVEKNMALPSNVTIRLGTTQIKVTVVGLARTSCGYASPELVYRLGQVSKGEAQYDNGCGSFAPIVSPAVVPQYVIARIHLKRLVDVLPFVEKMRTLGFECEFQHARIKALEKTRKMLSNLVLLIAVTSFLAVLLGTAGLMFEAVLRKRRLIALMRALGVPKSDVVRLYVTEAVIYAFVGFVAANLLYTLLAPLGNTPHALALLGMPVEEPVFHLSWRLRGILGTLLMLISAVSGYVPGLYASKIEPGVILSEGKRQ